MRISVLIATRGRAGLLARALAALEAQSLPQDDLEVVVCVDGPDPETVAVLERFRSRIAALRWEVSAESRGPAAARNVAVRLSRAPLLAITDDDCVPSPGWLQAIVDAFAGAEDLGIAIGRTTTERGALTPFSHYVQNLGGEGHQTCNIGYRRAVLEQLGGFDESFPTAYLEDTDLFLRAQEVTRVDFVPDAWVVHPPRETGIRALARSARKYESDFIFHAKHPELYRRRHRGHGPLVATLWYVGVKHVCRQVCSEAAWLRRNPLLYARFLVAMVGFECILWSHVPWYWLRHRVPVRPALDAREAAHP